MDIETLAQELRASQVDRLGGTHVRWEQLAEDVQEFYRHQAEYIQENVIKELEDKIKLLSTTAKFSVRDTVIFHDANYPKFNGKKGIVRRVGEGVLDVDFYGIGKLSIIFERAELIKNK